MDRLIAPYTVGEGQADRAPPTGTPGFATSGNPTTGQPPTEWPAYAWNMLQEEIRAVLVDQGVVPDRNNWRQLLLALQRMTVAVPGRLLRVTMVQAGQTLDLVPTTSTKLVEFEGQAGGGAGGACAGLPSNATTAYASTGGSAGSFALGRWTVDRANPQARIRLFAGTGGAAPAAGANGGNPGIETRIGGLVLPGGPGGLAMTGVSVTPPFEVVNGVPSGPPAGTIGVGAVDVALLKAFRGQAGGSGRASNLSNITSGQGANAPCGASGGTYGAFGGSASGALGPGAGGSGTATQPGNPPSTGGAGGGGYVIVREYS